MNEWGYEWTNELLNEWFDGRASDFYDFDNTVRHRKTEDEHYSAKIGPETHMG